MMISETISAPVPEAPWRVRSKSQLVWIVIASTLPAVLSFFISTSLNLPGIAGLVLVFLPIQLLAAALAALVTAGRRGILDAILTVSVLFLMAIMGVLLTSVAFTLVQKGIEALSFHAFYQNTVYITSLTSLEYGGLGHALVGTLITVGLAVLFAVPIGIAVGVFLTESRSPMRGSVRFLSQAMTGLPSIVSGLFVFAFLFLTGLIDRTAVLGSVALFLLMLPTVIRLSEEVLKLVPQELRAAAIALGAPRHKAFFQVVFPTARSGIITACLLGTARIIGETAPLIVLVSYIPTTNFNPLEGSMASLPTYIYAWLKFSTEIANQRAWGGALALMILVGILFTMARYFGRPRY